LSCKITILPDGIETYAEPGENLLDVIQNAGIPIEAECGGQGTCDRCVALVVEGACSKNGRKIDEGIILACQVELTGNLTIKIPTSHYIAPISKSEILEKKISDVVLPEKITPLGVDFQFESKYGEKLYFGIACDIGTTSVSVRLIDLANGRAVHTVSTYNEQIHCGADVISRIIYSMKTGRLEDLYNRIIRTINRLIEKVCSDVNIDRYDIVSAVLSGNTTMAHLLLRIDPQPVRTEPYSPAVMDIPLKKADDIGISIHPQSPLLFAPSVGSWVGGDISAGILFIRKTQKLSGLNLFIDIGTNGELVLMGDDYMVGCACSSGPAFEGVGIGCGMRAADGAIESIKIKQNGSEFEYQVIGGVEPEGICGSGLIELVSGLFKNGLIERDGKFNESKIKAPLKMEGRLKRLIIVKAEESQSGKAIYISEKDIANIIRAKAAIYSACSLLLRRLGLNIDNIERIFIAGGFGSHLNSESVVSIGMLPAVGFEKFEYIGNTSLKGAHLALISSESRSLIKEIARNMTYIDLSFENGYMDEYTAALFLPHTDLSLFPQN